MAKSDIWFRKETGQWYLNIWDSVRKVKIKKALGTNKRRAEEIAAQVRAKMLSSGLGFKTPTKSPTLDEFIPRFREARYAGKPIQTLLYVDRALRNFKSFAGNLRIAAIDKGLLQRYVTKRLQDPIGHPFHGSATNAAKAQQYRAARRVSKTTVNRELSIIICMMNCAVEWGVLGANPLARFKKFSEKDRRRKRYLQQDEVRAFLQAAGQLRDKTFLDIVVLALFTGRRRQEILSLKKTDYDAQKGYLYLAKTKKGEADLVPVPPRAQEVLDRRCGQIESAWIFPNDSNTGPRREIRTAFARAKRAAGLADFRFHDLRRTAISYGVMSGVDFFSIAGLAGHTTPTMIETTYGHLSPKYREATSAIFGSFMDKLTGMGTAQGRLGGAAARQFVRAAS
jgi:integrase